MQPWDVQELPNLPKVKSLSLPNSIKKKTNIIILDLLKKLNQQFLLSTKCKWQPQKILHSGKFYWTFKEEIVCRLCFLPENGGRENSANSFCRTGRVLTSKPESNLGERKTAGQWLYVPACKASPWETEAGEQVSAANLGYKWDLVSKTRKERTEVCQSGFL